MRRNIKCLRSVLTRKLSRTGKRTLCGNSNSRLYGGEFQDCQVMNNLFNQKINACPKMDNGKMYCRRDMC